MSEIVFVKPRNSAMGRELRRLEQRIAASKNERARTAARRDSGQFLLEMRPRLRTLFGKEFGISPSEIECRMQLAKEKPGKRPGRREKGSSR